MTRKAQAMALLDGFKVIELKEKVEESILTVSAKSFEEWRLKGESGEKLVKKELDKLYARMFDVGEFMKILKQWFSMEYNRRYSHK